MAEMEEVIKKTAQDYSKIMLVDMKSKLDPVSKSVDDMLTRMEEFQTQLYFNKLERLQSTELLSSLWASKDELKALFGRIDATEKLVEHVKSNLESLETEIEKAEEEFGITDNKTSVVANIFTPLFKRSVEKKSQGERLEPFRTEDYFQ